MVLNIGSLASLTTKIYEITNLTLQYIFKVSNLRITKAAYITATELMIGTSVLRLVLVLTDAAIRIAFTKVICVCFVVSEIKIINKYNKIQIHY